jgi:hypothetical protein
MACGDWSIIKVVSVVDPSESDVAPIITNHVNNYENVMSLALLHIIMTLSVTYLLMLP